MNTQQALNLARAIKELGPLSAVEQALVELFEHGERVMCPDFETLVRMVAANIHAQGKSFIEIAVDPATKEVAHSFTATPDPELVQLEQENNRRADLLIAAANKISELEGALELGQKNCDDVFADLKRERDKARAEAASLRLEIENLRAHGWRLTSDPAQN